MADPIYHITTAAEWGLAVAQGALQPESLLSEGFVHCSPAAQVERSARLYFPGRSDLVVVGIDPDRLRWDVRWEATAGGEAFPHVYGPVPLAAVISVHSLST